MCVHSCLCIGVWLRLTIGTPVPQHDYRVILTIVATLGTLQRGPKDVGAATVKFLSGDVALVCLQFFYATTYCVRPRGAHLIAHRRHL